DAMVSVTPSSTATSPPLTSVCPATVAPVPIWNVPPSKPTLDPAALENAPVCVAADVALRSSSPASTLTTPSLSISPSIRVTAVPAIVEPDLVIVAPARLFTSRSPSKSLSPVHVPVASSRTIACALSITDFALPNPSTAVWCLNVIVPLFSTTRPSSRLTLQNCGSASIFPAGAMIVVPGPTCEPPFQASVPVTLRLPGPRSSPPVSRRRLGTASVSPSGTMTLAPPNSTVPWSDAPAPSVNVPLPNLVCAASLVPVNVPACAPGALLKRLSLPEVDGTVPALDGETKWVACRAPPFLVIVPVLWSVGAGAAPSDRNVSAVNWYVPAFSSTRPAARIPTPLSDSVAPAATCV